MHALRMLNSILLDLQTIIKNLPQFLLNLILCLPYQLIFSSISTICQLHSKKKILYVKPQMNLLNHQILHYPFLLHHLIIFYLYSYPSFLYYRFSSTDPWEFNFVEQIFNFSRSILLFFWHLLIFSYLFSIYPT